MVFLEAGLSLPLSTLGGLDPIFPDAIVVVLPVCNQKRASDLEDLFLKIYRFISRVFAVLIKVQLSDFQGCKHEWPAEGFPKRFAPCFGTIDFLPGPIWCPR